MWNRNLSGTERNLLEAMQDTAPDAVAALWYICERYGWKDSSLSDNLAHSLHGYLVHLIQIESPGTPQEQIIKDVAERVSKIMRELRKDGNK